MLCIAWGCENDLLDILAYGVKDQRKGEERSRSSRNSCIERLGRERAGDGCATGHEGDGGTVSMEDGGSGMTPGE